jgi:hypothetical protein
MITSGYKRYNIMLALLLHYFIGCTIIIVTYPLLCSVIAGIVHGFDTPIVRFLLNFAEIMLKALPLYLSISYLFFMIMIFVMKSYVAMGISVAACIIVVVFTNKLQNDSSFFWELSPIIQLQELAGNTIDYFPALFISICFLAILICITVTFFQRIEIK